MQNKLVVLSFDALQSSDLDKMKKMPNFSKIFEKAAVVNRVREIYPTLTYPIHTTLITGVYPNEHGIAHNQQLCLSANQPDFSIMGEDWYWEKKHVKVKTLVDAVLEDGRSAATILWPVTAGEKRGWNFPEIWPPKGQNNLAQLIYQEQASQNVMDSYYDNYISKFDWNSNDDMVYYGVEVALDILRRESPDLLLCHVIHLDHIRHIYGVQCPEVDDCLRQLDIVAGRFIQATKDAGCLENTNFVILGDHGQIDIAAICNLNVFFQQQGLIQADENGQVIDYEAYSFSSGFSTQIVLKNPENKKEYEKINQILNMAQRAYPHLIENVYTAEEIEDAEHLKGNFSFVLEGRQGVLFLNELHLPMYLRINELPKKTLEAMHGHHPSKGEKPPMLAFGPDILPGVEIKNGDIIDIPSTLAKLCGVHMPQMRGKILPILK